MFRTLSTRIGILDATVFERNGRWRATLAGGHPSLHCVDSAIGDTVEAALINLRVGVEAALAPSLAAAAAITAESHA
jgi:hypothetical protein